MDHEDWWRDSGELPGMFNWAVRGLHRLYKNDEFTVPKICAEEIEDYRNENNPAREFLQLHYKENSMSSVSTQDIYQHYREWCVKHGNRYTMNSKSFGKEVYRFFPETKKRKLGSRTDRFYTYSGIIKLENGEF
jgi:putative DNA primase/helicase